MTDDATHEQVAVETNDLDQRGQRSGHKSASSQQATSRRNAATVVLLVMIFAHGFEGLAETKSLSPTNSNSNSLPMEAEQPKTKPLCK